MFDSEKCLVEISISKTRLYILVIEK